MFALAILDAALAVSAYHCHLGLGRLYRRAGRPEQAQEHLTTATAMYGELGMTDGLAKLAKGEPFVT